MPSASRAPISSERTAQALVVVRPSLQQKTRDRIVCERCRETADGGFDVGRGCSGDLHGDSGDVPAQPHTECLKMKLPPAISARPTNQHSKVLIGSLSLEPNSMPNNSK